jgi:hypothetical protein
MRAPELAARAVLGGVADDNRAVMLLLAARQQRAAIFGIAARSGKGDRGVDPCTGDAPAEKGGDKARAGAEFRFLAERGETRRLDQAHRAHQPRAMAELDAGQPIGPAVTHECLDDARLRVLVERDPRRQMARAARGDMHDFDGAGRGMIDAER